MKRFMRKFTMALLILIFLVSGGVTLKKYMDQRAGEQTYIDVEKLAGIDIEENQQPSDGDVPQDNTEADKEEETDNNCGEMQHKEMKDEKEVGLMDIVDV